MAVAIPVATANPAGVTADGSFNTTYTAVSTGTASNDRGILVCIGKEVTTVVANSVTIDDGTGVKPMDLIAGATFGSMGAWMYRAFCPTGTTADVVVNWSGAITNVQNHIAVYAITDAAMPPSISGTDTSTDMDATNALTTGSTTIEVNGGMLAVAVGAVDTVAKTWANLTEDLDVDAGGFRFTTAKSTTAGTATRTCTGASNNEDGALAYAGFLSSSAAGPHSLQPIQSPNRVPVGPFSLPGFLTPAAPPPPPVNLMPPEIVMPNYRPT